MIATSAAGTTLDTSSLLSPGAFRLDLSAADELIPQIEAMLQRFLPEGTEAVTRNEPSTTP
jgi:hypothetical protein